MSVVAGPGSPSTSRASARSTLSTQTPAVRPTLVPAGVLVLLVLQALTLGAALLRGSWFEDDLYNSALAAGQPLDGRWLGRDFFGHLLPAAQLPLWLSSRLMLHHAAVVLVQLSIVLCTTMLMAVVVRQLVGWRPGVITAATSVYALSTLTLPSQLWFAAAVELVPAHLCVVIAIACTVSYARRPRAAAALGAAAALAVGICAWDLVQVLIVQLPILIFAIVPGTVRERLSRLRTCWPLWASCLVPIVTYQFFYQSGSHASPRLPALGELARLIGVSWSQGLVPQIFGGPLSWQGGGVGVFQVAHPRAWFVILTQVLVVSLFVVTVRRRRSAVAGWALLLAGWLPQLGLVALGRLSMSGSALGRDLRYQSLTAVFVAVAVALVAASPQSVDQSEPSAPSAESAVTAAVTRSRSRRWLVGAAGAALAVASATSTFSYAHRWSQQRSEEWLRAASASIKEATADGRTVQLLNTSAPAEVFVPIFGPTSGQLSFILRPVLPTHGVSFNGPPSGLRVIDGQGQLRRLMDVPRRALTPSGSSCSPGRSTLSFRMPAATGATAVSVTVSSRAGAHVTFHARTADGAPVLLDPADVVVPAGSRSLTSTVLTAEPWTTLTAEVSAARGACLSDVLSYALPP